MSKVPFLSSSLFLTCCFVLSKWFVCESLRVGTGIVTQLGQGHTRTAFPGASPPRQGCSPCDFSELGKDLKSMPVSAAGETLIPRAYRCAGHAGANS